MKKNFFAATTIVFLFALLVVGAGGQAQTNGWMQDMSPKMHMSKKAVDLRLEMRELWQEHVIFTRHYIISALSDLEDTSTVAERLLTNQDDIGNIFTLYYGDIAGNQLTSLLRKHVKIVFDIVKEEKDGDNDALETSQSHLKSNAYEIAVFFTGANPNWKRKDMQNMLFKHDDLMSGEIAARLKKDWKTDIDTYDKDGENMLMFADYLTNGIVRQFSKKFQYDPKASKQ
ncbi:MAG: glycosyltransferase [Endomicrobiales bacterium]